MKRVLFVCVENSNRSQIETFDAAVTMGCGDKCPTSRATRHEDWQIPDPKHMAPEEFRAVQDLIESKVKELLVSLKG